MDRSPHRVVLMSLFWVCACATPSAQSKAAQDTTPAQAAEPTHSQWREMTWPEYYDSVMRNAMKRGATVVWINPPEVRKVERAPKQ